MEINRVPAATPVPSAPRVTSGMRTGLNKKLDPNRRGLGIGDVHTRLMRKVVGQEEGALALLEMYEEFKAELHAPGRPIGNLLFLGPTGVGKTRTVEAMAEAVFGDSRALIKIDCAEFQHSHEIAKLIGSPPGYLGHRETHPLLTQEALNQWRTESNKFTLVLFDEIEKASDALWQLLLGIMDKGVLTLGDNRRVDLSQCIIIMTSNLGAAEMARLTEGSTGFTPSSAPNEEDKLRAKIDKIATDAARRRFSPEFMNRIDKMVVFKSLNESHLSKILEIELGAIQQRILHAIGNNQFVFSISDAAKSVLLAEGFDKRSGARQLKRVLEQHLTRPMARLVSSGQVKLGDFIEIDFEDGGFTFTKRAEGALVPVLLEKYGNEFSQAATVATTPKVTRRLSASRLDELTT